MNTLKKYSGIILFFIMFFFTAAIPAERAASGKIKSITEWVTETRKEKKITYKDEYREYDKKGNLLTFINYTSEGTIREKEVNRYDSFGNLTEIIREEAVKEKKAENSYERRSYAYNAYRQKTEMKEYNREGQIKGRTAYTYNSDGKRALETEYDKEGKLKKKIVLSYSKQKDLIQKSTLSAAGDTLKLQKYVYLYH